VVVRHKDCNLSKFFRARLKDVGRGGGPDEWLWVLIMMCNLVRNSLDKFIDGAEDSKAKPAFGDVTKKLSQEALVGVKWT
jgi:hypothetical protein